MADGYRLTFKSDRLVEAESAVSLVVSAILDAEKSLLAEKKLELAISLAIIAEPIARIELSR